VRDSFVRAGTPILVVACLALSALASSALSGSAQAQAGKPGAPPSTPPPAATPTPAAAPAPAVTAPATPPAPPTEVQRANARLAYARGQSAFNDGRYEEARTAFQEAYAAVPNPIVLVTLAECDLRLGHFDEALSGFERYLKDKPDAADRAQIEQKVKDLLATPSILVLSSSPTGASVKVDGADTGKITPVELPLPRGEHKVELSLAGHLPIAETIDVRIGSRQEVHVGLQPEPPPPPPPVAVKPPPPPPPAPPAEDPTAALWITSIVGATGIVTGTVLGFMVMSERSDFDANPTAKSADRGERLALFADVAFGVGAMALITGAVLYLTKDEAPASTDAAAATEASAWRVTPLATRDGGGLSAQVRY
jgi:tetratricopeptide (TPR) repeat protein